MDNSISKQGSLLTYFGILPFLIFTLAIITGFEQEKAALFLRYYAAIIVSFISGIHFGIAIKDSQNKTLWLLATSNIIALIAWGSLLMYHDFSALFTLAICLFCLLIIDNKLYATRQIDSWFIKLRWHVTLIVAILLIISGVLVL